MWALIILQLYQPNPQTDTVECHPVRTQGENPDDEPALQDLLEMMRVSRKMHALSIESLYKYVHLKDLAGLVGLKDVLAVYPDRARHIQRLCFDLPKIWRCEWINDIMYQLQLDILRSCSSLTHFVFTQPLGRRVDDTVAIHQFVSWAAISGS